MQTSLWNRNNLVHYDQDQSKGTQLSVNMTKVSLWRLGLNPVALTSSLTSHIWPEKVQLTWVNLLRNVLIMAKARMTKIFVKHVTK